MQKKTALGVLWASLVCAVTAVAFAACGEETAAIKYRVAYTAGADVTVAGAPPAEADHAKDDVFTLKSNPFECETHEFAGWTYGGQTYQPNQRFTMPGSDVTFEAKWLELFTVTYRWSEVHYEAEGVLLPSPIKIADGKTLTLPEIEAESGYGFAGWKLGDTQEVKAGGTEYAVTGNITLTAQWIEAVTVTFAVGEHAGAGAAVPAMSAGPDGVLTLPPAPVAEEGYEFDGWRVGEEESKKAVGDKISVSVNTTVTATWKERIYNINYNYGEYATAPEAGTAKFNAEVDLSEENPVSDNADFRFAGWEVTQGGNPVDFADGKFFMPAGDVTVTAKWVCAHRIYNDNVCAVCKSADTKALSDNASQSVTVSHAGGENGEGAVGDVVVNSLKSWFAKFSYTSPFNGITGHVIQVTDGKNHFFFNAGDKAVWGDGNITPNLTNSVETTGNTENITTSSQIEIYVWRAESTLYVCYAATQDDAPVYTALGKFENFNAAYALTVRLAGLVDPNNAYAAWKSPDCTEHEDGDGDIRCDRCGAVVEHAHRWGNGVCVLCGEICLHEFDAAGECKACDLKRYEQSSTGYMAEEFNNGYIHKAEDAKVISGLEENGEIIFRGMLAGQCEKAHHGITVQIWNFGTDYAHGKECAFLQGNGFCADGSWTDKSSGNETVITGSDSATLESIGDADRAGYSYEIAVAFLHGTVTVTYRVWTDGDVSGAPVYTGVAVYRNVTEAKLAVAFGTDGTTLDDAIEIVEIRYEKKTV